MLEALLGKKTKKTVRYDKVVGQSGDYFGLNLDMDKTGEDLVVFTARSGGSIHYLKSENNKYVEKQILTIGSMNTALKASNVTYREQFTISPDGNVLVVLKNQANPASILVYKKNQEGLWDLSQTISGMKTKDMSCCDTSEDGTWLFVSSLSNKVFVFKMGVDGKYVQYQEISKTGISRKVYCSDDGNTFIATHGHGDGATSANLHVFMKNQNGEFVNTQSLRGLLSGSLSTYVFNGIKISGDGSTIVGGDTPLSGANSAYVFKLNPQTNQYYLFKTIKVSGSGTNYGMNFDISYSGNTIIGGDPGMNPGSPSGNYTRTLVHNLIDGEYVNTNVVTSDDKTGNDEQGKAVRISRDSRLCVTVAPTEKVNGAISGAIYSFGIYS